MVADLSGGVGGAADALRARHRRLARVDARRPIAVGRRRDERRPVRSRANTSSMPDVHIAHIKHSTHTSTL